MSFQSQSLAGLDCQSSVHDPGRVGFAMLCCHVSNQLRIHLISFCWLKFDLVSASDLATLKGKTLQECTANQLQWWTWILLSHPSCSARKSYCLRQLRRDRVSNRPRQSIIVLLSNSGKNEKKWTTKWAYKPSLKWIHLKVKEALMLRTYEKRFFLLREAMETFLQSFKELQHFRSSSQPIRFQGRIHTKHFFRVCFLRETIFCHE